MSTPSQPSMPGLSDGVRELAATMKLDADATIRGAHARRHALHETLPRISVARDASADLQLLDVLGEGGMGQVRLARQRALDRDVALKMVNPKAKGELTALLLQEGVITGRLEHPNIVPVHLMGMDENDRPIIVMKRVEGVPWSQLDVGDEHHTVWSTDPLMKHLEVFLEVCNAVAFAHDRGYVHRDIKPNNVMIGRFGEVYLLDWGISTPIGTGAFDHVEGDGPGMPLGTPLYMAPELVRTNGIVDQRTDVFLLGATLHRMLTGTTRHSGDDLLTVLTNAAVCLPFDYQGEIPDELAQMLNKATARRPGDRYASVSELREAVASFLRHRSSIELAREAEVMLSRMEKLSAQGADQSELRRTCTECRFAFMRAHKEWSDNERASRGLQRCLEIMARVELDLGQLDAARALIDEMPQPSAALREELEIAGRRKASEAAQFEDMRRLAHELDPTVSKLPRAILGIGFLLIVVGATSSFLFDVPLVELSPRGALQVMAPFIVVYGIAILGFRHKLMSTLFNRRIMILFGLGIAAMTLNRIMAIVANPPFEYMLGVDLFLTALIAATGGATMDKVFHVPAIIWAAGFIGIVCMPDMPMVPYAISQITGLLALIVLFYVRKA